MAPIESTRVIVGAVLASLGLFTGIAGITVSAVSSGDSDVVVATGLLRDNAPNAPVTFDARAVDHGVQLVINGTGSADSEREAHTTRCDIVDGAGVVHEIDGAEVNVNQLTHGSYPIGRAVLASGQATVLCEWNEPTDLDSRRAATREYEVVEFAPTTYGPQLLGAGFVLLLVGLITVAVNWRRFINAR